MRVVSTCVIVSDWFWNDRLTCGNKCIRRRLYQLYHTIGKRHGPTNDGPCHKYNNSTIGFNDAVLRDVIAGFCLSTYMGFHCQYLYDDLRSLIPTVCLWRMQVFLSSIRIIVTVMPKERIQTNHALLLFHDDVRIVLHRASPSSMMMTRSPNFTSWTSSYCALRTSSKSIAPHSERVIPIIDGWIAECLCREYDPVVRRQLYYFELIPCTGDNSQAPWRSCSW